MSLSAVRGIAVSALANQAAGRTTSMSVVRSTRDAANSLSGSTVPGAAGQTPVYLVQALGSFTVHVPAPKGSSGTCRGDIITYVIDAKTGQVLDWGIQAHAENLRSLGKVTDLRA